MFLVPIGGRNGWLPGSRGPEPQPMPIRDGLILTGATGLLGHYLLRDLLLAGHRVVVLARDTRAGNAADRVGAIIDLWSEALGRRLRRPSVLSANLTAPRLGLSSTDRAWLGRQCRGVVHAAAKVAMRSSTDGEPWRTNVEGTQRLLGLCADLGSGEFHHVSTAFVCGTRPGPIRECHLACGQDFHNDYELSKYEAERLVRAAPRFAATVYRPAVIVGDSRTGYTNTYHGFYRFLEFADRLAEAGSTRRVLPIRLPFADSAPRNLVPVDWVSQAVVQLIRRPRWHGHTFHLTARQPVPARLIKEVAERVLGIDGVRFAGPAPLRDPTALEATFLDYVQEYWPYLHGDPVFDRRHIRAALPDLPPSRVQRAMLARMVRFGVAHRWGRTGRTASGGRGDCAEYVERFFPKMAPRSMLAHIKLTVTVGLDVRGPGGGHWLCRWVDGELRSDRRTANGKADVTYEMDVTTFMAVVRGALPPQEAFFDQRIEVAGNVETGLKLAVLFGQFATQFPYEPRPRREARNAFACP
jgi:thioester reductase-like protein